MNLLDVDTKGLPRIHSVVVYPPVAEGGPAIVEVMLAGSERRAVERWAKRLGVQATERPLPGFPKFRTVEAVREQGGVRLRASVMKYLPDQEGQAVCAP